MKWPAGIVHSFPGALHDTSNGGATLLLSLTFSLNMWHALTPPLLDRELCSAPAPQGGGQACWLVCRGPHWRVERENSLVPERLGLARDPLSGHFLACPRWLLGQLAQLTLSSIVWYGGDSFVHANGGTSPGRRWVFSELCSECCTFPHILIYSQVKVWLHIHGNASPYLAVLITCICTSFRGVGCLRVNWAFVGVVPSFLLVFRGVVVCNGCLGLALTHFAQHEISLNCIRNKLVLLTSFLTVKKNVAYPMHCKKLMWSSQQEDAYATFLFRTSRIDIFS